jgi:hypothetical protein
MVSRLQTRAVMNNDKLTARAFVGVVVIGAITSACSADVEGDVNNYGVIEEPVWGSSTSGSGSGSGSGSNPCLGDEYCPTACNYHCDKVPVACSNAKKQSGWAKTTHTIELLATRYTVDGTCWMGKHTGIGASRQDTFYSESYSCATGTTTNTSTGAKSYQAVASNHGRTYDPNSNAVAGTLTYETGAGQPQAYEDAINACLTYVGDSFCDTQCGNDAYTIPPAGQFGDPGSSYQQVFSNRFRYAAAGTNWAGTSSSCAAFLTGSYLLGYFTGDKIRIPLNGHNSNTDANAERAMFGQCADFKSWLDSHCDVLASSAHSCGPDWATIQAEITRRVRSTCGVCGGFRNYAYTTPSVDSNRALPDSSLNAASSSKTCAKNPEVCGFGQPYAGTYSEGTWPINWRVDGM